ncbi:hypothetical protein [Arcticibacter sp. MXS-1]|uniref:hypothetical protein n=1 Tax=Arcticibacter sp. MXS-1 TaxID=3341726 RepID=UPI0035A97173
MAERHQNGFYNGCGGNTLSFNYRFKEQPLNLYTDNNSYLNIRTSGGFIHEAGVVFRPERGAPAYLHVSKAPGGILNE